MVYERNANRGRRSRVTRRVKGVVKPGLQHASAMTGKVFRVVRRNGNRLVAIPHNHVCRAAHAVERAVDEEGMYERNWMKHGGVVNF